MNAHVIAETVRRHLTHVGFIAFVIVVALLVVMVEDPLAPGQVWRSLFWVLLLAAGAQLIGPEFTTGTLQLILMRPIRRSTYLLSRVAGVVVSIGIALWAIIGVELVNGLVQNGPLRGVAVAGANTSARIVIVCAILALLGSVSRAYLNVAYYIFGDLILSILPSALRALQSRPAGRFTHAAQFVKEHPRIIKSVVWLDHNIYPVEPSTLDRDWFLLVFSNAAIALLLACLFFRRREVPYGGD